MAVITLGGVSVDLEQVDLLSMLTRSLSASVAGQLTSVNGHALESPPDLGVLWEELRTARAIEAVLVRQGARFTIRADVTE